MISIISIFIIAMLMYHVSSSSPVATVILSSWVLQSAQSFQLQRTPTASSRISTLFMGITHDYSRDTSSDTSSVDISAVNDLLGKRLHARKTGDFVVADDIRDRLSLEHKVTVFDQSRVWMTGENPRPNKGGRVDNRGGRGGRGRGPGSGRGGRGGRGRRDFSSSFGPNGHDYELLPAAGPNSSRMTEAAIHRMVAQRLMAKMNRDFEVADKLQAEMAEDGIFVNDRTKEWRADGVMFIDPSEGRRKPSDRNRPYVKSHYSQSLPEGVKYSLEKINDLVAERTQCKLTKNFNRADTIKEALEQQYNVIIDDRIREWSIGASFGKDADIKRKHNDALKSRTYVKSSASLPLPDGITQNDIQDRVDARTRARNNRQYKESDEMRDEILQDYNVVMHDAIRMWSVGGYFGMDDPVNARMKERGRYTRRGGGNLTEDEVVLITDMLKERFEAKSDRNFKLADDIRSSLYEQYNVNIDDKVSEWRVLSDDYIQVKPEKGARKLKSEDSIRHITSQLAKRIILKKNREYAEADNIRDALQDGFSILIDDKKHEWKAISSRSKNGMPISFKKREDEVVKDDVVYDPWFDDDDDDNTVATAGEMVEAEREAASEKLTMSKDDLMLLTIPLLKDKLRKAGKTVSGNKADLVEKLLSTMEAYSS